MAKVSTVPRMLDEPICALADVRRAAGIRNVGFCKLKLKLKLFCGLDLLREALDTVRQSGMQPVLGDGLSSELGCWMEACVASVTINNAGEFNGFLKPKIRLFAEPRRGRALIWVCADAERDSCCSWQLTGARASVLTWLIFALP